MIIRTLLTKNTQTAVMGGFVPFGADKDKIAEELSGAVKFPTVTLQDGNAKGGAVFLEFQKYLEKTYPLLMSKAKKVQINGYAVIYMIDGSDKTLLPSAFLAHQDVVPALEDNWEFPPYSGEIHNGYVYGRGAQDMKAQMIASLHAMEQLLKSGAVLKRGAYFCFGHDEELRGDQGAAKIAEYLEQNNVKLEYVLDEGGAIVDGKMLGCKGKLALIGTCEKGYADIILTAESRGGHASMPKKRTALGTLSEAVMDVELSPMKSYFASPVKEMFKELAPAMPFPMKLALVNRDILSPILRFVLAKLHPVANSLIRTTFAPTQMKGANVPNTLPSVATANINVRINTGQTVEDVVKHIKAVVGRKISVSVDEGDSPASQVSSTTSNAYKNLRDTICTVFGATVAPYMFTAATDSGRYYGLTKNVYRFTPFDLNAEDGSRIHSANERMDINALAMGAEFFMTLYKNTLL